jgi:uncharacterized membrane protein
VQTGGKPVRESIEFARIVAFTDGVFAIAITLLVLSLDVPSNLSGSALHHYLADSWRQFFAYFLSFAVIGRFWIAHHAIFTLLRRFDVPLLVLTLVYLSMIVLIPFPTELLGDYGNQVDAVILYAFVVGTASLMGWVMVRYMLRREHVRPEMLDEARDIAGRSLQPAIVFYASIPVALLSPAVGQLVWLALLLDVFRTRVRPAVRLPRRKH